MWGRISSLVLITDKSWTHISRLIRLVSLLLVQLCRCLYLRIKLFIYVRILLFIIFEVFRTIKISKFLFCGCFKVYFYILWVPIVTKGVTMPVVMTGSSEVITTCYDKRGRGCRYGGRLRLVIRVIRLKEISRTAGHLRTGCRHGLLPKQYKNSCVFVSFFPTLLISAVHLISDVHLISAFIFC